MKHATTLTTLGALLLAGSSSAQIEANGRTSLQIPQADISVTPAPRGEEVSARNVLRSSYSTSPAPTVSADPGSLLHDHGGAVGLRPDSSGLRGAGSHYRAHFSDEGFSFVPALGRAAEHTYSLDFSLGSVSRGIHEVYSAPAPGLSPEQDGVTVNYPRSGFTESYELRPEGVEVYFTFQSKPEGQGDLIVRGALSTDLRAEVFGETDEGLAFGLEGLGTVTIGVVTGIDADGRTATGRLHYDGAGLEFILPHDFVEAAAYPLVLDPLIGVELPVPSGFDDTNTDVAYNATEDVYMLVWQREFSITDVEIRGLRFTGSGVQVGGLVFIESTLAYHARPAVANLDAPDRFLVVYQGGPSAFGPFDIYARAVDAATGSVSNRLTVASTVATEIWPDAGGEQGAPDDEGFVVWEEVGSGIRAAVVTVPTVGDPVLELGDIAVSNSPNDKKPAITNHGGGGGHWLVAWQRFFSSPAPGDHDIFGRVLEHTGDLLTSETFLAGGVSDEEDAAVATSNGNAFAVVFERESSANDGDNDIYCLPVTFSGSALTAGSSVVLVRGQSGVNEIDPTIDFAEAKYVVAWSENTIADALNYNVMGASLASGSCKVCESIYAVDNSSSRVEGRASVFARYSASTASGSDSDHAMLAWQSSSKLPPFDSDINAYRLEALGSGGTVTNLGGGCGQGGALATVGESALGNPNFTFTLSGANPTASFAALAVSTLGSIVPCGPCSWLVFDPSPGLIFFAFPTGGAASITATIPCSVSAVGAPLYAQWLVDTPGQSPCFDNLSMSNIVRFTLGN